MRKTGRAIPCVATSLRATIGMLAATLGVVAVIAIAAAPAAQARMGAQYRIEGRGWGHNIGMSQYGANGFALEGWGHPRIIRHYFRGTVVAPQPASSPTALRVLLQSHLDPARVRLSSAGTMRQGAVSMTLAAGDVVEMREVNRTLQATRVRGNARTLLAAGSAAPVNVIPSSDGGVTALFASDHAVYGTRFRGTMTGRIFDGNVSVVNNVPFESYLRGVVPDEMPPSWHPQALRAQAVAARSYALRKVGSGYSWFDVYSDTRSQVYGGLSAEEASTDAAVAATAGKVARVGGADGEVAQTFFFSTSAGRTAGNEQVWGSTPYSYLRSVPSPHEQASPYFFWRGTEVQRLTHRQLASKLAGSYRGAFRGAVVDVYGNGFADRVRTIGSAGNGEVDAADVQARFGLRSTYFRFSYMMLRAQDQVATGRFAFVTGRVPKTGKTQVGVRTIGRGTWRWLEVTPGGRAGTWRLATRMRGNTVVALRRGGVIGPAIRIDAA